MFLFKIEILNFFILSQVILDFKHTYICVCLKMKIKKTEAAKTFWFKQLRHEYLGISGLAR